jgi:hypothetical protein
MPNVTQIFPETDSNRYLDSNVHIWRYVPLRTLFFYLNSLVFVPSVEKLRASDPFEGEFFEETAWFNSAFGKHFGDAEPRIEKWIHDVLCSEHDRNHIRINPNYPNAAATIYQRRYFEFVRRTRYAWCWFRSWRESAAMWQVYGKQGVAIQSTVGRVTEALSKTNFPFVFGSMTYVDYRAGVSTRFNPENSSDFALLLRPQFLKRIEYQSEHEVRFVAAAPEYERKGILLKKINPADWITAIRLWPELTSAEEASLIDTIHKILPGVDCEKSDLYSRSHDSRNMFERLELMVEESQEEDWKQQSDSIPPEIKAP